MLKIWREELDCYPYMYDVSEIASNVKVSTPRYDDFLEALSSEGQASRTHMSPTGFKTDLPASRIKEIFLEVASRQ